MARIPSRPTKNAIGLGFLPDEARHGFLIDIPKGVGGGDIVCISEHRGNDLDHTGVRDSVATSPGDPSFRVLIDRA